MPNGLSLCRRNHIDLFTDYSMIDYIPLSTLNDYIFCPYSIYLHSVYMESDEDLFKAKPQIEGTIVHQATDRKTSSTRKEDIMSLPVFSDEFGISGKIDVFKQDKHLLIERKNNLKQIFRGQIYQLWGQYFCMTEMGYDVRKLAFYEISTNKMIAVELPGESGRKELMEFIERFKNYNPLHSYIKTNPNKCAHCIYCNLCDKTDSDNVYS